MKQKPKQFTNSLVHSIQENFRPNQHMWRPIYIQPNQWKQKLKHKQHNAFIGLHTLGHALN